MGLVEFCVGLDGVASSEEANQFLRQDQFLCSLSMEMKNVDRYDVGFSWHKISKKVFSTLSDVMLPCVMSSLKCAEVICWAGWLAQYNST